MRKIILPLLASLAVASPALANETRVEARGGVVWGGGNTEAIAGVAAGYDFDLGPAAFAGAELSADKILSGADNRVGVGFTGRLGAKLPVAKLYVDGGYTTKFCTTCDGVWHVGAGAETALMGNVYGKLAYRRYIVDNGPDANSVTAGIGLKF
jgi:opacity protein-like surface antigen